MNLYRLNKKIFDTGLIAIVLLVVPLVFRVLNKPVLPHYVTTLFGIAALVMFVKTGRISKCVDKQLARTIEIVVIMGVIVSVCLIYQ